MARRFFELLLRLYPEKLRRTHGREMWSTFEAHLVEARREGIAAVSALWIREIAGAFRAATIPRVRRRGKAGLLGTLALDLRFTARTLLKSPGFSCIVVATIAVGIGADTAIFSVVNGVLLRPLPYPESDRLVAIIGRFLPESGFDFPEFALSEPEVLDLQDQSEALVDIAAYTTDFDLTLTGGGDAPERVLGASVSHELFRTLGTDPILGRTFTSSEDLPGGPDVVVIGSGLWNRRYGGDPAIVGRTIEVNGTAQQVIGVLPPRVFFPSPDVEVLFPLGIDPNLDRTTRGGHYLYSVARLAPGITFEDARAELSLLMDRWKKDYPDVHTGHFLFLRPLLEEVVGGVRNALWVLMAAVAGLLLVASANVGNLFLARGEERRREMTLRIALGAGRLRLFQQMVTESLLLCLVGGLAGVALAAFGLRALLAIDPDVLPKSRIVTLDAPVLLGSLAVVLVFSIVFAALPTFVSRSSSAENVLREAAKGLSRSRAGTRFRRSLVIAEIASSLALVVSAGLLVKSLSNLLSVDPGFRPQQVLSATLQLPGAKYEDPRKATAFFRELLDEARALPGVQQAASISDLPLGDSAPNNDIRIEGRPEPARGEPKPSGSMLIASDGYFELLGVPLVRGRFFEPTDREGALPVAVVSRTMAESFWPHEDPIGQRFNPLFGEEPLLTIVGVVGDVKYQKLGDAPRAAWYFPLQQSRPIAEWASRSQRILLRVDGDPLSVVAALRELVRDKDPELVVSDIRTMEEVAAHSVRRSRFTATLLTLFATLAVALGASGVFAVIAFSVARRGKELGIRAALGATQTHLVILVAREGFALCAIGVAIGILLSLAATRGLQSLLFGVSATDPMTFAAVALAVSAIASAASYLPARRVTRIDPVETLQTE